MATFFLPVSTRVLSAFLPMFGVLIGTAFIFAVLIRTVLICKFEDVGDVSRNLPLVDMYVTERVRVCCTFPSDVSFRI